MNKKNLFLVRDLFFKFNRLALCACVGAVVLAGASQSFAGADDWIVNGSVAASGTTGDDVITTDSAGGSNFLHMGTDTGNDILTFGVGTANDFADTDAAGYFIFFGRNGTAFIHGAIDASGAGDEAIIAAGDLNVTISSTGSITAGGDAIFASGTIVVHNNGAVFANDDGVDGIDNVTVVNTGTWNVATTSADGVQANDNVMVTNDGIWTATGNFGNGVQAVDNVTVVNHGTWSMSGNGAAGVFANDNVTITNTGTWMVTGGAMGGFTSDGVDANDNITVTNTGTWMVTGFGGDGVEGSDFINVTNHGTWTVLGTFGDGVDGIVDGNGDNAMILNTGTWTVLGAFGNGVLLDDDATVINHGTWFANSEAVEADENLTLINTGTMTALNGDVADAHDMVVENYGRMESVFGRGLDTHGAGTLNYYGGPGSELIAFDNAIDAGFVSADDVIIVDNGSVVSWTGQSMDLGGGDDLVRLIGHPHVFGMMDGDGQPNADRLEFFLFGLCGDTEDEIEALIAGGAQTFTYWGETYVWDDFEIVTVDGFKFENWAHTPNQRAIARVFDCIDVPLGDAPDQDVIDFVDNLYALGREGFSERMNQLSHQRVSEAFSKIAFTNHDFMLRHLNNRSSLVRENATDMWDTSGFTLLDNTLDPKFEGMNAMLTAAKATPYRTGRRAQAPVHQDDNRFGLFLSGNAIMAEGDGTPDIYDYEWDTFGILAGADYKLFPSFAIGIMGGYSHTDVDLDNYGSDADIDTYIIGTYANWWWNNFYVNGMFSYCFNEYDGHRNVPFLHHSHSFNTDGDQFNLAASCGYDFHFGNLAIGPIGGIRYTNFSVDGFTEGGHGIDKLTVADDDADSLRTSLGAKATYTFNTKVCAITPEVRAAWGHEYLDDSRGITARFNSDQLHPFTVKTTDPERDWAELGASVRAKFNETVSAFIDYDAQVGQDDFFAHSVNGGLRLEF